MPSQWSVVTAAAGIGGAVIGEVVHGNESIDSCRALHVVWVQGMGQVQICLYTAIGLMTENRRRWLYSLDHNGE